MVYTIVITFLFLIYILFFFDKYKKLQYFLYIIIGISLIFIVTFRGPTNRDYGVYRKFFYSSKDISSDVEISFIIIKNFIRNHIDPNGFLWLLFVYAAIGVSIKLIAIKQLTDLYLLSFILYISTYFMLHEMTQIREGIASGLLLLCVKPIYERNKKRFITYSFVAIFFHTTSVTILPFWFLKKSKINLFFYSLIIPIGFLCYFLSFKLSFTNLPIAYIQTKLETYNKAQMYDESLKKINVLNVAFLLHCIFFYIMLIKHNILFKHSKYLCLLLKIYGISLAVFPALAFMPVLAFRFYELFNIVSVILIPYLIYLFRFKVLGEFIVIGISFIFLYIFLFYDQLII